MKSKYKFKVKDKVVSYTTANKAGIVVARYKVLDDPIYVVDINTLVDVRFSGMEYKTWGMTIVIAEEYLIAAK